MKRSILMLSMALSCAAFAQDGSLTTAATKKDSVLKGFFVGVDYMNLSDIQVKYKYVHEQWSDEGTSEGGTHVGLAGIRLGYGHTPESGFGYEGAVRFSETFNKSEYGDNKLYIVIPEANATFAANRYLVGYAGLNAAVLNGSSVFNDYRTRIGAQLGFGVRFTEQVAWNAGYTIINQRIESRGPDFMSEGDLRVSGFNSSLTYMF